MSQRKPIVGRHYPGPRLTLFGAAMIMLYAGVPILLLGLCLDLLVWLAGH